MKPFKPQHKQFALDYMARHSLTENDIDDTTRAKILTAWRVSKKRIADKQKGAANIRIEFKPIAGRLLIDTAKAKGVTPSQLIIELLSTPKPALIIEPVTPVTIEPVESEKLEKLNLCVELARLYGYSEGNQRNRMNLIKQYFEANNLPTPKVGKRPSIQQQHAILEFHKELIKKQVKK